METAVGITSSPVANINQINLKCVMAANEHVLEKIRFALQ